MNTSVIICTWNRATLLDQTLRHMRGLAIPPGVEWELIIVNNNSTDGTDTVIARHKQNLPIRRLFEGRPGKSVAANLAIAHAKGNLLLWTDDDALVDRDWLAEYFKAAQQYPDVMYFGGPVEPWFAVTPPQWIRRHFEALAGAFATRRIGEVTRPIEASEYPYGVNMATRRQAFDKVSFDMRIGPIGKTQVRGEDTTLIDGFRKQGYQGLWVATARLQHYIPPERLTYQYIWDFHAGLGKTEVRLAGIERTPLMFGVPRWALFQYLLSSAKAFVLSPVKNEPWLRSVKRAAWLSGLMAESRVQLRANL